MTETNPANESNTIINEMVATLKAGTFPTGIKIFGANVYPSNSVDRFKETRLSYSGSLGIAGIINGPIEEFVLTDGRVGNVLPLTILIGVLSKTPEAGVTNATKLLAAVKNLLNGDIPSTAEGFYKIDEEEMTLRISWGEPEVDSDEIKKWVFIEIPCFIAYVTTSDTGH